MNQKTCAACDCELDEDAVKVKLGGKIVEACCEECAARLRDAYRAATNVQLSNGNAA